MSVREICSNHPVSAHLHSTVESVSRQMHYASVGSVIITDASGRPLGIVTDRDLVGRVLAQHRSPDTPIGEVMTRDLVVVTQDASANEALQLLRARPCRRLPVVDAKGYLTGVVTLDDILDSLLTQTSLAREILDRQLVSQPPAVV